MARLTRTALHSNLLNLENSKTIHVVVAVVVNVCSARLTRAAQDYIKPDTARLTRTAQTSHLYMFEAGTKTFEAGTPRAIQN